MPPPTRRLPIQSETLRQAEWVALSERMSRDLSSFNHEQRREDDALALENIGLRLPEDMGVTGTTGYESLLGETEPTDPTTTTGTAPEPVEDYGASPKSWAVAMPSLRPTVGMPDIESAPSGPVYDPTQTAEIAGPPDYDPTMDAGTMFSGPNVPNVPSNVPNVPSGGKFPEEQARIYRQAKASGLDDEGARVLVAVSETEGGARGAVGDRGRARGVYQFHEGGEMPGFRAWLRRQGIEGDPDALAVDPEVATRYAAEGYLGQAIKRGRELGYSGAELATYVQRTGQRSVRPETTGENYTRLFGQGAPSQPVQAQSVTQRAAESRNQAGETRLRGITPEQFGLGDADAEAICGPVLAMAFARSNGRNPTIAEAKQMAARYGGWTTAQGMGGPEAMANTLRNMGIPATYKPGPLDIDAIRRETQNGNPVGINTAGHYFVVEGVDEQGRLDLGNSARALRASRGRQWFKPDEIVNLGMGAPTGAIYKDAMSSPTPSVAVRETGLPPVNEAPTARRERDALALAAGSLEPAGRPSAVSPSTAGGDPLDAERARDGGATDLLLRGPLQAAPAEIGSGDDVGAADIPAVERPPIMGPGDGGFAPQPAPAPTVMLPGDGGVPPQPQPQPITATGTAEVAPNAPSPAPTVTITQGGAPTPAAQFTEVPVRPAPQPVAAQDDQAWRGAPLQTGPTPPLSDQDYIVSQAVGQGPGRDLGVATVPQQPQSTRVPVAPPTYRQGPAEDAAAEIEREQAAGYAQPQPVPTLPGVSGRTLTEAIQQAQRGSTLAVNPLSVYQALQELPFDVYARARQELISDAEARRLSGTDPLAPLRALGVPLPSVEELNPEGRPASDVLGALLIAGALPDPADPYVALAFRGAGRALGAGARVAGAVGERAAGAIEAGGRRIGQALDANAERVAAADARMAESGSTQLPGVFGVSGIEPNRPEVQGLRPRVVPPDVADTLDFPVRVPEDPRTIRAIEAAGGRVDPERGVDLYVTRAQSPSGAGQTATRGGVFYEAVPPGGRSSFVGADDPNRVGGSQVIPPTPTRFRSPLILSDAPGEMRGFNEGMEQLGDPRVLEARRLYDEAMAAEQAARDARPFDPEAVQMAFRRRQAAADAMHAAQRESPPIVSADIDAGIRQARAAGPEGSPARAQALKALVARYGGDPDLIDDLLRIRGADASESAWAIKENILAANARKAGYDGVVTVQSEYATVEEALEAAIKEHPEYQVAWQAVEEAQARVNRLMDQESYQSGIWNDAQWERHGQRMEEANAALEDAEFDLQQVRDQLANSIEAPPSSRITELADVREARNPTPPSPTAELKAAYRRAKEAEEYLENARAAGDRDAILDARRELAEAEADLDALMNETDTPSGYELRADVPRRPETRASTIVENPTLAEAERELQAALDDLTAYQARYLGEVPWEERRANGFEAWLQQTGNEAGLAAYERAGRAEAALAAAERAPRYVTAPPEPPSTKLNASAGPLPPHAIPVDTLGAANRAAPRLAPEDRAPLPLRETLGAAARTLNTEALNAAGGAFAANVVSGDVIPDPNDQRTPQERVRDALLHGGVGAVAAILTRRGAGRLARMAGQRAEGAEGALATFGAVPPSARETSLGEWGLPPLDASPPRAVETPPSAPARTDAVLKQFTERIRDPEKAEAAAAEYQRLLDEGASPEAIATFLRGAEDSRWWDRFDTLRYASMLSDPVTHGQNAIGNVQMGVVDVIERPLTALLDKGRARITGGPREAFLSEGAAQVVGMAASAPQALKDAAFIMAHGMRPEDIAKLDVRNRGFATDVPGVAPRGSRAADVADFVVEGPLRALAAADALFRGTSRGGHLAAEAERAARVANGGRPATPGQVARAMLDPEVAARADARAAQTVLQEDRAVTDAINSMRNKLPPAARAAFAVAVPYIKTPFNIVGQGVGMTPAGLISLVNDVRRGAPMAERERRVSRMLIGAGVMAWASWENLQGLNTGAYPEQASERSTLPPGWRPYSRKVELFGETYYVPLAIMGPLAIPAMLSILATERYKKSGEFTPETAASIAEGVGTLAQDQTFLRSIADFNTAMTKGGNALMNYIERQASQFSPHVIGGGGIGRRVQAILGEPSRDPDGVVEAWLATLPYGDALSDTLGVDPAPVRRDVLGRPSVTNPEGVGALVPIRASREDDAPVIAAFRFAGEGLPRQAPDQLTDPQTRKAYALSRDQQARWQIEFGQEVQARWQRSGSSMRRDKLQDVKREAREAVNARLLREVRGGPPVKAR